MRSQNALTSAYGYERTFSGSPHTVRFTPNCGRGAPGHGIAWVIEFERDGNFQVFRIFWTLGCE